MEKMNLRQSMEPAEADIYASIDQQTKEDTYQLGQTSSELQQQLNMSIPSQKSKLSYKNLYMGYLIAQIAVTSLLVLYVRL